MNEHLLICDYRYAICPKGCTQKRILGKDLEYHVEEECLNRDVTCVKCRRKYGGQEEFKHMNDDCVFRLGLGLGSGSGN
jgi:hypothetical protein